MIGYPLPDGLSFVGRLAQSRVPAVPKPRHLRAQMPAFHSVSLSATPLPVSTGNETARPSVWSRMLMRPAVAANREGSSDRRLPFCLPHDPACPVSFCAFACIAGECRLADQIAHSPSSTRPTITQVSVSSSAMSFPVASQAQESTGDMNDDAKKYANANHNA